MKFKDIFDKAVLVEEHVRKGLKIFYEIDLDLIKPKEEEQQSQQPKQENIPQQNDLQQQQNTEMPQVTPTPEAVPVQATQQPEQQQGGLDINSFNVSVVTEDEVSETTEDRIIRKFEGEIKLSDSSKDNIQSFEDIVDFLSKFKKNGTDILDEFSSEIITLCLQQNYQEIKSKLDKKSKIFVEIYYGYKKDDSVGIRFNKRTNSELLTSTMMVDNEIISSKFNIEKINQQVAEYRNYEAKQIVR